MDQRKTSNTWALAVPLTLLGIMTLIQVAASVGIVGHPISWANIPRTMEGIPGIFLSHLRHDGWGHLARNAIPFVVLPTLAGMMMPRYTRIAWLIIPPLSGALLWVVGRSMGHIGASAMIYGWFFFIIGMMFFHRSWAVLCAAVLSLFFFGGLIWVFQGEENISWDGHATGALAGAITAWIIGRREKREKV